MSEVAQTSRFHDAKTSAALLSVLGMIKTGLTQAPVATQVDPLVLEQAVTRLRDALPFVDKMLDMYDDDGNLREEYLAIHEWTPEFTRAYLNEKNFVAFTLANQLDEMMAALDGPVDYAETIAAEIASVGEHLRTFFASEFNAEHPFSFTAT